MLRGPETRVWLGRAAIPAGEHPEIILDRLRRAAGRSASRDEVGVIQVGGDGPADVRLSVHVHGRGTSTGLPAVGRGRPTPPPAAAVRETHRDWPGGPDRPAHRACQSPGLGPGTGPAAGRGGRGGRRLCLAVLDLDQFKEINDTQGHAAGDRVLQAVSRSLQKNLRQGDFVARLGGDEFGLLLWVPGEAEAAAIVERVRSRVAEAVGGESTVKITASAGFALSGGCPEADTCESLFLAADAALIAAKRGEDRLFPRPLAREGESRPHPPSAMEQPEHRAQQERVEQDVKGHERRGRVPPPEPGAGGLVLRVAQRHGQTEGGRHGTGRRGPLQPRKGAVPARGNPARNQRPPASTAKTPAQKSRPPRGPRTAA